MYDKRQLTEFVEAFLGESISKSELSEELISHFGTLISVYPYGESGIVVSGFADGAEHPVDLEGSHPSVRCLSNLCASHRRHSYRW